MMGYFWKPLTMRLPMKVEVFEELCGCMALIPVIITEDGFVSPVEYHGLAHISALSDAGGIITMPAGISMLEKGAAVNVRKRSNRSIDYLRISVTDRCNLRCRYCMPEEGIQLLRHEDILTFDEIKDFTRAAVDNGIRKVRITGGEPLVRKGIVTLVGMIASIRGINDLSMTTNAVLLEHFAKDLSAAGLQRVNISLDMVDPQKYAFITRSGNLSDVFRGIEAAKSAE